MNLSAVRNVGIGLGVGLVGGLIGDKMVDSAVPFFDSANNWVALGGAGFLLAGPARSTSAPVKAAIVGAGLIGAMGIRDGFIVNSIQSGIDKAFG